MPLLTRYDSVATIPPHLEAQIRTLLHAEWPGPDVTGAAQCSREISGEVRRHLPPGRGR